MKKTNALKTIAVATLAIGIATPASASTCHVSKGDSMWKIAKRYHVNFRDLCDMNRHFKDLDVIFPKDKINLPTGSEGHSSNQPSHNDGIEEGNETSTEAETSNQARAVLDLVNQERAKQGLAALTLSNELTSIANTKAADMRDKNYFSHNSPTYGSPFEMLQQFGVRYSAAGENIAAGQKSPEAVMRDWMNSSGHRANILNANYTKLGVGYVTGGSYGSYWVQLFTK